MKKTVIVLIVLIIILFAAVGGIFFYLNPVQEKTNGNQNIVYVNITKENFAQVLSGNSFVINLPDSAVISLKVDEDYYAIKKGSVTKEQANSPDFQITLPGEYIPMLGNLCSAVDAAKKNGDLGFETSMSKTSLLWKYKSMLKYRECFGF